MRKNIRTVLDAFIAGRKANGDSKRTCWTDVETVYSYALPIAGRKDGRLWILDEAGRSMTTRSQIRACRIVLERLMVCVKHEDCLACPELAKACYWDKAPSWGRIGTDAS